MNFLKRHIAELSGLLNDYRTAAKLTNIEMALILHELIAQQLRRILLRSKELLQCSKCGKKLRENEN